MPHTEPRDYYVSIVRDSRKGLLVGPYATHTEALAAVNAARTLACELDQWAVFDAFGTCSVPRHPDNPKGKLNSQLGVDSSRTLPYNRVTETHLLESKT